MIQKESLQENKQLIKERKRKMTLISTIMLIMFLILLAWTWNNRKENKNHINNMWNTSSIYININNFQHIKNRNNI